MVNLPCTGQLLEQAQLGGCSHSLHKHIYLGEDKEGQEQWNELDCRQNVGQNGQLLVPNLVDLVSL